MDRRSWALVLGLTALAYLPSLRGGFVFDDVATIVLNRQFGDWDTVWRSLASPAGRGLFWLSLHWDHAFAGGQEPAFFHAVNLAMHLACTAMVAHLALRLPGGDALRARAAGLLFGLHPLATGTVCYISQRSGMMAAFFTLASFLALARGGRGLGGATALLCWVLAVGSKESAVAAPFSALALLGLVQDRERAKPWMAAGILGALALGIWGFFRAMDMAYYRTHWDLYALSQPRVIWLYLGLWLMPFHQSLDPDPGLYAGWLLPLGLAALVWASRRLGAWTGAWIAVALVSLLPESSVIGTLSDLMFEYRMYLPCAALALAAAPLLARSSRALAALAVLLAALTAARAVQWGSEIGLWREALRGAPRKMRVHANLSVRCRLAGDWVSAERVIRRSLRIRRTPDQYRDLALVGLEGGDTAMGMEAARQCLALEPGRADCLAALGRLQMKAGDYAAAARDLAQAREKLPDDDGVLRDLATALALSGDPRSASVLASRLKASDPETFLALGTTLGSQGKLAEAVACLVRYTTLRPENPLGWANLSEACRRLGHRERSEEARRKAVEACGERPEYAGIKKALEDAATAPRP